MLPRALRRFILSSLLFSQHALCFWILAHHTLTTDRLDPIVSPGEVSGHVHTVVGASNFGPTVDYKGLLESKCTTADVQDDKSSYWAPQLYHKSENGSLTLIPILFVNTYYKLNSGTKNSTISAFPEGLRMLAGDPYRTSYDANDPASKAVGFVCLDYSGTSPESEEFPKTNCKDGLRAQITFPSCWDGKNVDSDDHKSHMSYPEGGNPDAGDCPESHPIRVITLFHEWIFDVNKFEFKEGQKNWVFSFGDDVGYGFHADFVNGWKEEVLEAAVKECTGDLFNDVEKCSPFTSSINKDVAQGCKIESQVDEDIGMDHPISALPGCNPIPVTKNAQCSNTKTPAIDGSSGSASSGSTSTEKSSSTPNSSTMSTAPTSSSAVSSNSATTSAPSPSNSAS